MTRLRRGPEAPSWRWGAPGWLVAVATAAVYLACLPAFASAESAPPMCQLRYAPDYAAQLAAMPHADPPPEGELPFGPRNFSMHWIDLAPYVLEGSHFGYRFAGKNSGFRVLQLGWRATATLRAVDADGRVRKVIGTRRWEAGRVKDLDPLEIAFPADRPGFFRVDLHFETIHGRKLGAYREYFRVLRRSVNVAVAVNDATVHPGESVYGLLENRGAGRIVAPGFLGVERNEAGSWVEVPQPPSPESVAGTTWWVGTGEVARCQRLDLPLDATPGSYRFTALVYAVNSQKHIAVNGEFEVVP